jgi:hypothetical protein
MSIASTIDITIDQGTSFLGVASVEIDLTDGSIFGEVRESTHSPLLASFTIDVVDAENGGFTFSLSHSQTMSLPMTTPSSPLKYDILLIKSSLERFRLVRGNVIVREAITMRP